MANRSALARQGEIKIRQETVAGEAIADPATYWATTPRQLRVWDVDTSGLKTKSIPDMAMQTNVFKDPPNLLLAKELMVKFKCYLSKLSATTPAQDTLGRLFTAGMGAQSLGPALTTVDATNVGAGATADLKVTSTAGMAAGQAIKVGGHLRRIRVVVSGVLLTLDMDLPSVPTSGNVVGSQTNYLSEAPLVDIGNANHLSHAWIFRGYDASDQQQLRGAFPELEFLDLGKKDQAPKVGVTMGGIDGEVVSGVAVGADFTEGNAGAQVNTGLYLNPQNTLTNNEFPARNISVKLGLKLLALEAPSAPQGILGYIIDVGRTELECEVLPDKIDQLRTAYPLQTLFYGGLQLGADCLFTFPQLTLDEEPIRVGGAGAAYWKVKMHADNGPLTTNELTKSRIAVHRFG